jgi:hypothetical protein
LLEHTSVLFLKDFSNTIRKADIEQLAEVDEHEVIREVQEYFGDYLAINPDLFSLGQDPHQLFGNSVTSWQPDVLNQTVAQLSAVLLSLKKRPLIRYQGASEMAKTLAEELQRTIQQEGQLFDFRRPDTPPIMLILDRRNDPVTPLLTQWTYQAMVHELIGIHHGRVDMSNVPEVKNELKVRKMGLRLCCCGGGLKTNQNHLPFRFRKLYYPQIRIHFSKSQCISTWAI